MGEMQLQDQAQVEMQILDGDKAISTSNSTQKYLVLMTRAQTAGTSGLLRKSRKRVLTQTSVCRHFQDCTEITPGPNATLRAQIYIVASARSQ